MDYKMKVSSKVSCGARVPAGKPVTALHLFAEEQVRTWWCGKKTVFAPIITIDLDKEQRNVISDTLLEYPGCCVKLNLHKIRELDADCLLKMNIEQMDIEQMDVEPMDVDQMDIEQMDVEPMDVDQMDVEQMDIEPMDIDW